MAKSVVAEVVGLRKHYGDNQVLKDISFSISEGEIFALLGPNGAGKTTCLEILSGHRSPTAGQVLVFGQNPHHQSLHQSLDVKEKVGIMPQGGNIEPVLTPREAVEIYSSGYAVRQPALEVLEMVGLSEKTDTRIARLSGGQKRKLDLALGLAGCPSLLFLDEPTTGFSPEARRETWQLLDSLRKEGMSMLLTSHYMEEVDFLSDRMAVLQGGEIVYQGTPSGLGDESVTVEFGLPQGWSGESLRVLLRGCAAEIQLKGDFQVANASGGSGANAGPVVVVTTKNTTELLYRLTAEAQRCGLDLEGLEVRRTSLEDNYLKLISGGEEFRDRESVKTPGFESLAVEYAPAGEAPSREFPPRDTPNDTT